MVVRLDQKLDADIVDGNGLPLPFVPQLKVSNIPHLTDLTPASTAQQIFLETTTNNAGGIFATAKNKTVVFRGPSRSVVCMFRRAEAIAEHQASLGTGGFLGIGIRNESEHVLILRPVNNETFANVLGTDQNEIDLLPHQEVRIFPQVDGQPGDLLALYVNPFNSEVALTPGGTIQDDVRFVGDWDIAANSNRLPTETARGRQYRIIVGGTVGPETFRRGEIIESNTINPSDIDPADWNIIPKGSVVTNLLGHTGPVDQTVLEQVYTATRVVFGVQAQNLFNAWDAVNTQHFGQSITSARWRVYPLDSEETPIVITDTVDPTSSEFVIAATSTFTDGQDEQPYEGSHHNGYLVIAIPPGVSGDDIGVHAVEDLGDGPEVPSVRFAGLDSSAFVQVGSTIPGWRVYRVDRSVRIGSQERLFIQRVVVASRFTARHPDIHIPRASIGQVGEHDIDAELAAEIRARPAPLSIADTQLLLQFTATSTAGSASALSNVRVHVEPTPLEGLNPAPFHIPSARLADYPQDQSGFVDGEQHGKQRVTVLVPTSTVLVDATSSANTYTVGTSAVHSFGLHTFSDGFDVSTWQVYQFDTAIALTSPRGQFRGYPLNISSWTVSDKIKLGNDNFLDDTISGARLTDDSVAPAKLQEGISGQKLLNESVSANKLAPGIVVDPGSDDGPVVAAFHRGLQRTLLTSGITWRATANPPALHGLEVRRAFSYFHTKQPGLHVNEFEDIDQTDVDTGTATNVLFFFPNPNDPLNTILPGASSIILNHTARVSNKTGVQVLSPTEDFFLFSFQWAQRDAQGSADDLPILQLGTARHIIGWQREDGLHVDVGGQDGGSRSRTYAERLAARNGGSEYHLTNRVDAPTQVAAFFSVPTGNNITYTVHVQLINNGNDEGTDQTTYIVVNHGADGTVKDHTFQWTTEAGVFSLRVDLQFFANLTSISPAGPVIRFQPQAALNDAALTYVVYVTRQVTETWNVPATYVEQGLNNGGNGLNIPSQYPTTGRLLIAFFPYRTGDNSADPEYAMRVINTGHSVGGRIRLHRSKAQLGFDAANYGAEAQGVIFGSNRAAISRLDHYTLTREPSEDEMLALYRADVAGGDTNRLGVFNHGQSSYTRYDIDGGLSIRDALGTRFDLLNVLRWAKLHDNVAFGASELVWEIDPYTGERYVLANYAMLALVIPNFPVRFIPAVAGTYQVRYFTGSGSTSYTHYTFVVSTTGLVVSPSTNNVTVYGVPAPTNGEQ